jgi:hypothetical protein
LRMKHRNAASTIWTRRSSFRSSLILGMLSSG